jgi:hypothetical protein
VRLTTLPCKNIVEKPPRNSAILMEEDFGGGQGLSWAVELRRRRIHNNVCRWKVSYLALCVCKQSIGVPVPFLN